MTIWLNQILQGVLLGGYYALIACGLSFMYSVMRIINLAHGSLAVLAAFGLFVLADRYDVSPFLGLLIVLPAMAVIGVLLQRLVLDRSTRGGLLVPILSTFGLAVVIDNLLFQQFGADTRSLAPYLGSLSYDSWSLTDDIDVGELAALIFATAVVVLGGLHLFLSHTPLGRAIRATAEDPDTVGLVGIDARLVNATATAIAMVAVGLAGFALGMRATFDPYAGGPQLIFAFEAAVIGGAGSLWGTLIGGIVLGVAQSLGAQVSSQGFLIAGHLVFLAVLFGRIFAASQPRSWRAVLGGPMRPGAITIERWTPASMVSVGLVGALLVALAFGPLVLGPNAVDKLTTLFIYVILAVTWNALAGYAGLVSVGQQAFFGLGAYAAVRLSDAGLNVFPALMLGAVLVGILALPLSVVMLRLKGGEFAIGMWVVAELAHLLVNLDSLVQGETGTSLIALNGFPAELRHALTYWTALGGMALVLVIFFVLLRSRTGAGIQAIRDNEEAAASVGVRVEGIKRTVFVLAAFGAALAGALWIATAITFQPKTYFSVQWTAYMIFMVLVGGLGTFEGAILGAVMFFAIEAWFGAAGVWYLVGLGATALVFALFLPGGLWGLVEARAGFRLLPVGYRLRLPDAGDVVGSQEAGRPPEHSAIPAINERKGRGHAVW